MKYLVLFSLIFFSIGCAHNPSGKTSEDTKLEELFEKHWAKNMEMYPEWSTWENYKGGIYNDRWSDRSLDSVEKSKEFVRQKRKDLDSFDYSDLSERFQLYFDLYKNDLDHSISGFKFEGQYLVINQLGGFQMNIAQLLSRMPQRNLKDYQNILVRFKKSPEVIKQNVEVLRAGLKKGITPPKVTMRDVPEQFQTLFQKDYKKNPLTKAFTKFPSSISKGEQEKILGEMREILPKVIAAFKEAHQFVRDEYVPNCRESIGFSALPMGEEWYNHEIKGYTTLDMSADEIHSLGLSEVKRIKEKMKEVIKRVKYKGSFSSFLKHLRTHPKFFYKKKEDLLKEYRNISKLADGKLLKVFKVLPRTPYGVLPTPHYMEKSAPTAYYYSGNIELGNSGTFYANTYNLKARPKWEMVALTLHEAMPGHHLQISIAQEQEEKPDLIKNTSYTGYVEGWGLYAESLGEEMEMYEDPYNKFGQLTYEMWRAIRLVVDTGMHSKGWSRDKAIQFFKKNAPKTLHDITVEVDRYINWPGQALSYKLGELKFKELRNFAKKQLGDKFDLREYHHQVLKDGALPLTLVDSKVKSWVSALKN
jgi:uncharacterized protein (DUF885 family)